MTNTRYYRVTLDLEWEIEAPVDATDEDILDELNELICRNNETVENLFWDGMDIKKIV